MAFGVAVVLGAGITAVAATEPAGIDGPAAAAAPATRLNNQRSIDEPTPPPEPQAATYRVTVISEWTAASHPTTLPNNSHFSPVVVASHGGVGNLFAVGTLASPGIESMAETGSTSTLRNELSNNDLVIGSQVGSSIFGAGVNAFEVTAFQADDLVSVVTMLAPSPDWFVGVSDVELFVDGTWIDGIDVDLGAYDAGTDSGSGFQSPNAATSPAQPISGPRDNAFAAADAEGRFGRVVIERIG